jgi:hypothetical protein
MTKDIHTRRYRYHGMVMTDETKMMRLRFWVTGLFATGKQLFTGICEWQTMIIRGVERLLLAI